MDVRNCCDRTLDVPALNVYGLEPGQSLRERATAEYADFLDTDAMVSLLLQPDCFEPADDEATQALADLLVLGGHLNPPAPAAAADGDEPAPPAKTAVRKPR